MYQVVDNISNLKSLGTNNMYQHELFRSVNKLIRAFTLIVTVYAVKVGVTFGIALLSILRG